MYPCAMPWNFKGSKYLILYGGQTRWTPRCSWRQWDTIESQLEVCFLHCSQMDILPEPFKLTCLKDPAESELRDMEGDGRSPLQCCWELRGSQGASDGLRGPMGWGTSCLVAFSSFWANDVVVGAWWALFGASPNGEGAHWPSTWGEGVPEEEEANLPASWIPAVMRSTYWLTGVPTLANSSS